MSAGTLTNVKSPLALVNTSDSLRAARFADERDGCAGNDAALRVLDRAGDRAGGDLGDRGQPRRARLPRGSPSPCNLISSSLPFLLDPNNDTHVRGAPERREELRRASFWGDFGE